LQQLLDLRNLGLVGLATTQMHNGSARMEMRLFGCQWNIVVGGKKELQPTLAVAQTLLSFRQT
jgi:hypothetical protein